MGVGDATNKDNLRFTPLAPDAPGAKGFTPDASALAHYMTYGPVAIGVTPTDAAEAELRRNALKRLIDEAFR